MGKLRKRITSIIAIILVVTIVVLLIYMEWSRKTNMKEKATEKSLTEAEKLLERDLDTNYPGTPREVAKYYSSITELLYSGIEDDEIEGLAKKIRLLYDDELLQNNPEEIYLTDLYSDIAAWNKAKRTITNYLLVNEELETRQERDGREYANVYVSYTIQERGKVSEVRKYIMRKSEDGKWKIFTWDYYHE